jgi:hypothetical protein
MMTPLNGSLPVITATLKWQQVLAVAMSSYLFFSSLVYIINKTHPSIKER